MSKIIEYKKKLSMDVWRELILEQQSSGMTIRAWCEAKDINYHAYYYHLRVLRELEMKSSLPAVSETSDISFSKVEIPVVPTATAPITIRINGIAIDINAGTNKENIESVLRVVKKIC